MDTKEREEARKKVKNDLEMLQMKLKFLEILLEDE
jgi:hypothetical protein